MLKRYLPFFLVLLFLKITSISFSKELTKLINKVQPTVVSIICYDEDNVEIGYGSGFFIDKNIIITNRHVLEGSSSAKIETYDNNVFNITHIINEDVFADIVIAEVDIKDYKSKNIILTNKHPNLGESIFVIGNPLGLGQTVSTGIVSGFRSIPDVGSFIQISAPISHGSSGSPVFNMNGEVIAVVTLQITEGQNYNLSVPISIITSLGSYERIAFREWSNKNFAEFLASADGLLLYSFMLLLNEEYEEAIKSLYSLPIEMQELSEFNFLIGLCYFEMGKYDKAINAFETALKTEKKDYETLLYLGKTHYFLENFETSVEYLLKSLELNAYNYATYSFLGLNLFFLEEYELALNGFDLAIDLNDSDAFLYIMRANTKSILDDLDGFYLDYQKAYEINPNLTESLDFFEVGQYLLKNNHNNHYYYFEKGLENFYNNEWNSAIIHFSKAIDIEKHNFEYHFYRGIAKYENGDYENALVDLNIAIKLNPSESNYYFYRGKVKHILKEYVAACSDWHTAKRLGFKTTSIYINHYCE